MNPYLKYGLIAAGVIIILLIASPGVFKDLFEALKLIIGAIWQVLGSAKTIFK